MKKMGTVTIDVFKSEANQYSFSIKEDNDDLCCVVDVLEDTLKYY